MAKQRSPSEEHAYKQKRSERRKALKAARAAGIELPSLRSGPRPSARSYPWPKGLEELHAKWNKRRAERNRLVRDAEIAGLPIPTFKRGRPRLTEEQKAERVAQKARAHAASLRRELIEQEEAAELARKTEIQAALARCPQRILDELDREYGCVGQY